MSPRDDLGTFTFLTKYARYLPEKKRRETHQEAIRRMMDMHRQTYPQAGKWISEIERDLLDKKILPSQRALQFGGTPILRNNMRMFNCSASFCDRPRFFAEAFWLLLCGSGVGFSVQRRHVQNLPPTHKPLDEPRIHTVQDSIEGWADAADALVQSYLFPGSNRVEFDFHQVRPEGSPISSASGKAPGPKPLAKALEAARGVLERAEAQFDHLRPVDCYDIMMHLAEAVRSGGVRRSATICLFSPDDQEMVQAKTGDWFAANPQRRMSNNSALIVRGEASREDFEGLMAAVQQFGEPGFVFVDHPDHVTNPCGEAGLTPVWEGDSEVPAQTSWSCCNCTSINIAACKTDYDFLMACETAAALGTLQAGYTDTGYLGPAAKKIHERDALLGVSITGMADNPALAFDPQLIKAGASIVRMVNADVARSIGIVSGARLTFIKPEGTGSLLLGVGNGVHPHHARRYLRYVEAGKISDPVVSFMTKNIPQAVVQSAYNPEEVKVVFPVDLGEGDLWLKAETDPVDHLQRVKMLKEAWVDTGTRRGDASHNVSNTVVVPPADWDRVGRFIWKNRETFGGVALLGQSGDLDYPQAPFVEVLSEREALIKYRDDPERLAKATQVRELFEVLTQAWKRLDWSSIKEEEDNTRVEETVACAGGACTF